jgi:DNA-binding PadR family transcriptional regulator
MKDANQFLPLSPAALHILLALAGEEMHGYGIMQEVVRQSEGRYKLGPGTLYDNLQRLTEQGLVLEVESRAGEVDSRRRYYRLTTLGQRVIAAEIGRLEDVVREGKLRMRAPGIGRTS